MTIREILESAKWAPSGDNSQPWVVIIRSEHEFTMNLNPSDVNVYNLFPLPNWITTGMFLENASIAAQQIGQDIDWHLADDAKMIHVTLVAKNPGASAHLFPYIKSRSVNRFSYRWTKLTPAVKLEASSLLDDDIQLHWLEDFPTRCKLARLLCKVTDIRLRIPETYGVHRDMVEWEDRDSSSKMPAKALGINSLSLKLMRWALASEARNRKMLSLPGSTLGFQFEMDIIPSVMCAAHFLMSFDRNKTPCPTVADYIRAGLSMQRFWLYLTSKGISLQPWYVVLMLSRYIQNGIDFTVDKRMQKKANVLAEEFDSHFLKPAHVDLDHVFFTGRVGYPRKHPLYRSVRKPTEDLIAADPPSTLPID